MAMTGQRPHQAGITGYIEKDLCAASTNVMDWNGEYSQAVAQRRGSLHDFQHGPLASYLAPGPVFEVGASASSQMPPDESQAVVFAGYRLQDVLDYRAALQSWFHAVRVGGFRVIVVPHAFLSERQISLPSRWNPAQQRLYTPASLLGEIEEALVPNSYRVRWLSDDDSGYDYQLDREYEPVGARDVLLAIERIAVPHWGLCEIPKAKALSPDFAFEPDRTRVEFVTLKPRRKILILKLDHLGDFIMAIPALEKARSAFADSEISLMVGSWNLDMARELAIADRVLSFDVFPVNSSEEKVDVPGKTALFEKLLTEDYDLAIDFRTDYETRFLLKSVPATIRAGIGTKVQFPFLDIFLPVDFSRNEPESARDDEISHKLFSSQTDTVRSEFRISCAKERARRDLAIIWGPYFAMRPGRYFFEPYLELDPSRDGLLSLDIALDRQWVTKTTVPAPERVRLPFVIEKPGTLFEFRIWAIEGTPAISFSFFGGRLLRVGGSSVLHQSEYLSLLVELISMRMDRFGVVGESAELL
jgi:hypothetical protein